MRTVTRFALCGFIAFGYLFWTLLQKLVINHPKKPNIIFILADDLGWGDIGYNNPFVISPNINSLAREGIILNQSYVSQSCGPSRAALMTGYYSYRLGFQAGGLWNRMPFGVPLKNTLLPRKLRQLGYSTYMVGKWHLGFCKAEYLPTRRGFDKFYGYYLASGDHFTHRGARYLDLHDDLDPDWGQNGTYSSYLFTDKAVEMINNHDTTKPFFLYLAYQNVHSPIQVPQKYYDMYPSVKNKIRRTKLGMVTAMDDGIGKLVETLKQNGLWENTLVVFSSDNGAPQNNLYEGSNWPLLGTKQTLFEGGTRAVGFIRGNMLDKTGYIYDGMVHIVDWYPTLVSIAGGKIKDKEMDGINVFNALSTNAPSPRKEVVYNIIKEWDLSAIRYGDFKLLILGGSRGLQACWAPPPEAQGKYGKETCVKHQHGVYLFNIKDDPQERFNLATKFPDKVAELRERLAEKGRLAVPAFKRSMTRMEANPDNFKGVWSPGWC